MVLWQSVAVPFLDLPLADLRAYRPAVAEPADFDEFWAATIDASRDAGGETLLEPYDAGLSTVDVWNVTFPGFAGEPVKGWFMVPAGSAGALPTVIEFNGYGGGRGLPHEKLAWVSAGYAYFFMDTRGQGSTWGSGGSTADAHGSGASAPGSMTRGIENPADYFYRRVFTDAVRAVDAVRDFERVDATRLIITGTSQGGGIALAVAGLVPGLAAVMPDVPFLCHFERAIGLTDSDPYNEVVRYLSVHRDLVDQSYRTLSYFDGVNFARRATAPALFSVALMDPVCPPSTVFAVHNLYEGEASIEVYPFNEHEGGLGHQWVRQAAWLREIV